MCWGEGGGGGGEVGGGVLSYFLISYTYIITKTISNCKGNISLEQTFVTYFHFFFRWTL